MLLPHRYLANIGRVLIERKTLEVRSCPRHRSKTRVQAPGSRSENSFDGLGTYPYSPRDFLSSCYLSSTSPAGSERREKNSLRRRRRRRRRRVHRARGPISDPVKTEVGYLLIMPVLSYCPLILSDFFQHSPLNNHIFFGLILYRMANHNN